MQNGKVMIINKKYKLFNVTKFISVLPTFSLIQQSLSRTRCWMKSLHSVSKITLKWNQRKSPATRLKSAKYKTHVIIWFHLRVLFETECKFFIQHLVLDNDCCISRNIGRTEINLVMIILLIVELIKDITVYNELFCRIIYSSKNKIKVELDLPKATLTLNDFYDTTSMIQLLWRCKIVNSYKLDVQIFVWYNF